MINFIFQSVLCLLCNFRGKDEPWHAVPAGLAAGTTYFLQPNITFIMTATSNIIQVHFVSNITLDLICPLPQH